MMKYSLKQVLMLFKRQQTIGFQGINFCIAIVEDDELSDADKREAILDLFERIEFYSEEWIDKRIKQLEQEIQMKEGNIDSLWDIPGMGPVNPTQVFDCVFLNGKARFEWCLN